MLGQPFERCFDGSWWTDEVRKFTSDRNGRPTVDYDGVVTVNRREVEAGNSSNVIEIALESGAYRQGGVRRRQSERGAGGVEIDLRRGSKRVERVKIGSEVTETKA
jgi:hypothetical protein